MTPTHDLQVVLTTGDTLTVVTHRPDMSDEQLARDLAHRIRATECMYGVLNPHDQGWLHARAVAIPVRNIAFVAVSPRAVAEPEPAEPEAEPQPEVDPPAEPEPQPEPASDPEPAQPEAEPTITDVPAERTELVGAL